jgi:xanthine dehydrogenase YagR molybdenum-binding subunit
VICVEEHEAMVKPLGTKGLGDIGLVGVAAAMASAVFHATGTYLRGLPILPDTW